MIRKHPFFTLILTFTLLLLPHPFFAQLQEEIQHSVLIDSGHASHFSVQLEKETLQYAVTDGEELWMDIYRNDSSVTEPRPCLLFVSGAGSKRVRETRKGTSPTLITSPVAASRWCLSIIAWE